MCIDTSKIPNCKNEELEFTTLKKAGNKPHKITVREDLCKKNLDEPGKKFFARQRQSV
jgi:hypothetical protein